MMRFAHASGPSYQARKFDVQRALALYQSHAVTRLREQLIGINPESDDELRHELLTAKFTVLVCPVDYCSLSSDLMFRSKLQSTRDSTGAAIVMFSVHKHSPLSARHAVTLQAMVYQVNFYSLTYPVILMDCSP